MTAKPSVWIKRPYRKKFWQTHHFVFCWYQTNKRRKTLALALPMLLWQNKNTSI